MCHTLPVVRVITPILTTVATGETSKKKVQQFRNSRKKREAQLSSCPLRLSRLGDSAAKVRADMPYQEAEFPRALLMIIQSSVCRRTETTNQQCEKTPSQISHSKLAPEGPLMSSWRSALAPPVLSHSVLEGNLRRIYLFSAHSKKDSGGQLLQFLHLELISHHTLNYIFSDIEETVCINHQSIISVLSQSPVAGQQKPVKSVSSWGQFQRGVIPMSQKDKKPYIMQIDSTLWNTHALKTTPPDEGAPSACSQGPAALALRAQLLKWSAEIKLCH